MCDYSVLFPSSGSRISIWKGFCWKSGVKPASQGNDDEKTPTVQSMGKDES